ncbi:MAG: hypothetical protein GEV13_05120 [Rhodospirillales bacterium]|nr:hypothetical protein [Rhodospirillales bacterium]
MRKSGQGRRSRVRDDSPLSAAELRTARPARDAVPHVVEAVRRRGRPRGESKALVTLRLDKDVVAALRAGGDGWQTRINELLRVAVGLRG